MLDIWPDLTKGAARVLVFLLVELRLDSHSPPEPEFPALFDTTVKSWILSLAQIALINVCGTPQSPKPM